MTVRNLFICAIIIATGSEYGLAAEDPILKMGSKQWKYLDTAEGAAEKWNTAEFDDSKWKSGQAPLGYGDPDIKQQLSFGDDEGNKRPCAFFRRSIEIKDPKSFKMVEAKLICDDGCVVYLNGKEVHRFNLPEGEIKLDTRAKFAMGGELERYAMTFLIAPDKFKTGKNLLAVRVQQQAPTSSDLALDMSLEALVDDDAIQSAKEKYDEEQQLIKQIEEEGF